FVLLMTARALIKVIHQHDATGFELLAGMHHVAQDIFVLMVGVDVDYIEVGVREALDALDGSCTNHTYARLVRETANDSLVVLLLMLIGIIAVVFPVHASGKGAEILGGVPKGIVLVRIKFPIIDEVVSGWSARIKHDLREIAFVNSDFGPDRVLGDRPDQAVPIAQHEIHNYVPLVRLLRKLAKGLDCDKAMCQLQRVVSLKLTTFEGESWNRDPLCRPNLLVATYRVMTSTSYQHAIDSGVYLSGVDSSHIGTRLPVERSEIGDPSVFLIIGQSNGGNHGETKHAA